MQTDCVTAEAIELDGDELVLRLAALGDPQIRHVRAQAGGSVEPSAVPTRRAAADVGAVTSSQLPSTDAI